MKKYTKLVALVLLALLIGIVYVYRKNKQIKPVLEKGGVGVLEVVRHEDGSVLGNSSPSNNTSIVSNGMDSFASKSKTEYKEVELQTYHVGTNELSLLVRVYDPPQKWQGLEPLDSVAPAWNITDRVGFYWFEYSYDEIATYFSSEYLKSSGITLEKFEFDKVHNRRTAEEEEILVNMKKSLVYEIHVNDGIDDFVILGWSMGKWYDRGAEVPLPLIIDEYVKAGDKWVAISSHEYDWLEKFVMSHQAVKELVGEK